MRKLIWMIIVAFGLAALPFGGTAVAGQDGHNHKAVVKAGKSGKHLGKKHHKKQKHVGKKHKRK